MGAWRSPIVWLALGGVASAADLPIAPAVKEPELRAELLERSKADQAIRNEIVLG